jgi:cytochrome c nitrite reductase small subunit
MGAFLTSPSAWPRWLRIVALIVLGAVIGLGGVVMRASNAASYLFDDAETCLNCHVMSNAYATWLRGSHGKKAVCNDCHVPHTNIVGKLGFKAMDGARHAAVFTAGSEPQTLTLNEGAVPVVQNNCLRCHANQFLMIRLADSSERPCWDCHPVHGAVQSLSASEHSRRPSLPKAGIALGRGDNRKDNDQ